MMTLGISSSPWVPLSEVFQMTSSLSFIRMGRSRSTRSRIRISFWLYLIFYFYILIFVWIILRTGSFLSHLFTFFLVFCLILNGSCSFSGKFFVSYSHLLPSYSSISFTLAACAYFNCYLMNAWTSKLLLLGWRVSERRVGLFGFPLLSMSS